MPVDERVVLQLARRVDATGAVRVLRRRAQLAQERTGVLLEVVDRGEFLDVDRDEEVAERLCKCNRKTKKLGSCWPMG